MNNKIFWVVLGILAAGLLVYGFLNIGGPKETSKNQNIESNNPSPTPNPNPASEGGIEGKLMASDNKIRGNLMLVTPSQTLYIRTSRDFSALIGTTVVATIDGDVTNFRLLDIVAK